MPHYKGYAGVRVTSSNRRGVIPPIQMKEPWADTTEMNNIRLVGVIIYLLRFGYLMDSNAEA